MSSPTVSAGMEPGRRLGHYEIQSKLGAGGMGTVYQAMDTRLNRTVALKVLSPDRWEGTAGRGRLMREAQAASALNHPNIVTVYEIGHDAGVDFIAMERVEGRTLGELASRRLPVDLASAGEVRGYYAPVCFGCRAYARREDGLAVPRVGRVERAALGRQENWTLTGDLGPRHGLVHDGAGGYAGLLSCG